MKPRYSPISKKIVCVLTSFFFGLSLVMPPASVMAQTINVAGLMLSAVGEPVHLTKAYNPLLLNGLTLDPQNPLKFNFLISLGEEKLSQPQVATEANKQIKYFLAALTVPEKELWVNLSPYEQDRIIPAEFGKTEMGRDLLGQDYILKQLSSSLMYPESELGQRFWKRVHEKAEQKYGNAQIPTSTFNKIWIVPDQAVVYQHNSHAYVLKCHLKVMLAEDYEAMMRHSKADLQQVNEMTSAVIREILIPEIEKEVNEGKTFSQLRQVFNALVLAAWFKKNLQNTLVSQVYVDQNKVRGIDVAQTDAAQSIYQQYLAAIKQGVYNYIKEEPDPVSQEVIPRKYFAGGVMGQIPNGALQIVDKGPLPEISSSANVAVETNFLGLNANSLDQVSQAIQSGQPVVAASAVESLEDMVISLAALAEEGVPVFVPDLSQVERTGSVRTYLPVYVDTARRRDIVGMKTSLVTIRKANIFPAQSRQIENIIELLSNPSARLTALGVNGQGVVRQMVDRLAELADQGREVFVPTLSRGKPSPHLGALLISYVHAVETNKQLQEILTLKELLDYPVFQKQRSQILALLDIRRYRFHDIPPGLKTEATKRTLTELSAAIAAGDRNQVIDRLEQLAGQLRRMGDAAAVTRERIIYEDLELARQYLDHRYIEAALDPQSDWRKYFEDVEGKRLLVAHPQIAILMRDFVASLQSFEQRVIQEEMPPHKEEFEDILKQMMGMETTTDFGSFEDNQKVRLQVQRFLQDNWLAQRQSWRVAYLHGVKKDLMRRGGFHQEDYLGLSFIRAKMGILGFDSHTILVLEAIQKIQKRGYPVTVPAIANEINMDGMSLDARVALVNEQLHTHIQPVLSGGIFNIDVVDATVVAKEQEEWFSYLMNPDVLLGIIYEEGITTLEELLNYIDNTIKAGKNAIRLRLGQVELAVNGKVVKLTSQKKLEEWLTSRQGQTPNVSREILKTAQDYEIYVLPHPSYVKLPAKIMGEDAGKIKEGISRALEVISADLVKDYSRIREIRNINHKVYYVKFFPNEKKAVILVFAPFNDLVGGSSYAIDAKVSQYYNQFVGTNKFDELSDAQAFMVKAASSALNADQSQTASTPANQDNLGGINLDPALLDLQIKRDEQGVLLPTAQQPLFTQPIQGFIPVIIRITPVANVATYLNQ